jgi:phosphoglycerol transferase
VPQPEGIPVRHSAARNTQDSFTVSRWITISVFVGWWLASLFAIANIWVVTNFGQLELPQFVYHVVNLREVVRPMGLGFVVVSALAVIMIPLALGVAGTMVTTRLIRRTRSQSDDGRPRQKTLQRVAPVLSVGLLLPGLVLGISTPVFAANIGVLSFIENSQPSGFIERFYEFPDDIQQPDAPLNLVMIYVESLENTYRNPELWGENLLDSLDKETQGWATFPNFQEVRGTGWTIAGLVASQCGVLLKEENQFDIRQQLGLASINRIGEQVESFMPGITCLGDILDNAGYRNHFLGGADPEFAGKGKFLIEHGYHSVKGQPHWESMGERVFTKWGLHDDKLLGHAKRELNELHASGEPFTMTVLTVDTHRPEGHLSATCERRGAEDLPGIVACTSDLLADFVRHMERNGYLDDTVVVITGDHLSMPNVVQDTMDLEPHRTIYNRFWSPNGAIPNRDDLYHFSILPTVLDLMGFEFPGKEMALGVSGVGEVDPRRMTIYDVSNLDDQLRRPSELYNIFWDVDDEKAS